MPGMHNDLGFDEAHPGLRPVARLLEEMQLRHPDHDAGIGCVVAWSVGFVLVVRRTRRRSAR